MYIKIISLSICLCGIIYYTYLIYIYKYILYYKAGLYINLYLTCINIDIFSLILIYITILLYLVCIVVIWEIKYKFILLHILLFIIICLLISLFSISNLLIFYILFELLLIPIFLIIGIWGSRSRRITAAYQIWLYTVFGSFFFFLVIIYLFIYCGTVDIYKLYLYMSFYKDFQKIGWLFLFISFAVKFPVYPFYGWLPEAHAEAPTVGSILLAGILLKIGPYGLIKFNNFLFSYGVVYYRPLIFILSLISLYYVSLNAISQVDIKKIIAYSSIGHMSIILLGIIVNNIEGLLGSFGLIIGHSFISAGLFFLIGCIYDRYKTRFIFYYRSLLRVNVKLGFIFFLFFLANIGFPGTINFLSELFCLIGILELNMYIVIFCCFVIVLNLVYNLFLFVRIFFLNSIKKYYFCYNVDLIHREFSMLFIILVPIIINGLYYNNIFNYLNDYVLFLFYSVN